MSLEQWAKNGWLRAHQSSRQEVADLMSIVDRDLKDSTGNISPDWRFGIAYNAALRLCTILLHVSGYRPEKLLQHFRTISALSLIMGDSRKQDADFLEACRTKRNTAEYDLAGTVTSNDAAELLKLAKALRKDVLVWLEANHPNFVPK